MSRRDAAAWERLASALRPAGVRLARARGADAVRRTTARICRRLPLAAALVLVVTGLIALRAPVPFWLPPLALLAVAGAAIAITALGARARAVSPGAAALACDRAHDHRDRLSAALELAGAPGARGTADADALGEQLARAAIADGLAALERTDPERIAHAPERPAVAWRGALASLLVLGLATHWLPPFLAAPVATPPAAPAGDRTVASRPAAGGAAAGVHEAGESPAAGERRAAPRPAGERRDPEAAPAPDQPAPTVPAATGAGPSGNEAPGESAQSGAPKSAPSGSPGAGRPGGGQGSAAASAAEPAPEPPKDPAAAPKPRRSTPPKPTPDQEAKAAESAGAPSGPSRGSGRMAPVGNKRQDLARGMERQDEPEVEDEAIEDEQSEQEQRGGVMPMRRQDQRPAGRELSISGDGPPDQGRGGPTPPKKARGTASLVLGIRLPDQVRGQPNPGTAKTSLEQIPPRPQQADPGLARSASPGRAGTPQSPRAGLGPLQPLLAAYHELLRRQAAPAPASPVEPDPATQRR